MASAEELLEVIQRQGNQALQMIAALQDVAAQQRCDIRVISQQGPRMAVKPSVPAPQAASESSVVVSESSVVP